MASWEHFEHGADVGVRGWGDTPEEAFVGAAEALFALVAEDLSTVRTEQLEAMTFHGVDLPELLVAFLNELISLADARRLVFGRFDVSLLRENDEIELEARAWGERYDRDRHASTVEPKGASFTALKVAREDGRWVAQCVVDV